MSQLTNIQRYYTVIDRSLFTICGKLDYDRITEATIKLANAVHDYDGESEELWSIGEFGTCSLSDFIVGAYWHFTEWHGGQWSESYKALCALGQVFSPGYGSIDSEIADQSPSVEAYNALNDMTDE